VSIQLLLFVDERPSSQEIIRQIQSYLQSLRTDYAINLRAIEIGEQPHLVEHFKLIATPALVKIFPEPRQTLAGSNIVEQVKKWCPRWQLALEEQMADRSEPDGSSQTLSPQVDDVGYAAELMRLSDEVFRLKQEKEELLEQLKFKDQVLAMLAHDLRSPLTAASIAVETLELTQERENTKRTLQLREQLYQQARKQFRLMNRIITEILQASKSMNAELRVHHNRLYLQSLCEDILVQFAEPFQAKSQTLETDIPQDLPPVYADAELIRQVIVNLLDNACKYTPERGRISVSILHRTTQKVQVSVCDTGPGIPEEKRERIFEGHFRLKRDESKEGYGLGLSMCRKIIRAHYGQIWVDSVLERGSCFHFTLPVYR
jgi:two-component system clock-associated histidine kinase SasA